MEVSWSDLLGLARISLMNWSKRVEFSLREMPAAGTVVQSERVLHFRNFALGSRVVPFSTR